MNALPEFSLRLLAVCAHPDDETLGLGGSLAVCADRGVRTCLVTCTDGRRGLDHAGGAGGACDPAGLAVRREAELRAACATLGVDELHLLGYADSGEGDGASPAADGFRAAELDEVCGQLAERIRAFRPQVVVTGDPYGGNGHPDHIQAHRATLLAVEAAGHGRLYPEAGAPWVVTKLYYAGFARSTLATVRRLTAMAEQGLATVTGPQLGEDWPGIPDEDLTTSVDCRAGYARKLQALREHRSQIPDEHPLLLLPEEMTAPLFGTEHFRLVITRVRTELPESDLFAGVDPGAWTSR